MSIWNNLYKAYKNRNCEDFKKYWNQLTEEDKKSIYFSYYSSLKAKLCPQKNKKGKLMMKGKVIKCPSCGSPITISKYNKEQIKKLKNGEKQIEFICNYCGNKFIFSDKPFKSLFSDYAIGKELEIEGKKVKISGAVKYVGRYVEDDGGGKLTYIEWLAYDENGEIYYLSESVAEDYEGVYKSSEITKKVDFPFLINSISRYNIETDKGTKKVKEYDNVKVVQIYGNVNKGYKIGEDIELYNFDNYTLEVEKTDNGIERNLYQKVSRGLFDDVGKGINFLSLIFFSLILLAVLFFTTGNKLGCTVFFWIIGNFLLITNKEGGFESFIGILIVLSAFSFAACNEGGGGTYYSGGSSWGSSSYGGGK